MTTVRLSPFFSALLIGGIAFAQTPPGLLDLPPNEGVQSIIDRNWGKIYVPSSNLLLLERVHREKLFDARHVAYKSQDLAQTGLLAFPKIKWNKEDPEEALTIYPAIIIAHGSENGVTQPYREIIYEFARRGYVVMAPSFRGHMGIEGRSQGSKEYAKGEVLDLLQAAQLVRKLPYVNSMRMAVIGFEHGASVTMQAVARSNIFQAAIAVSPVLFSGSPTFSFAGIHRLRSVYLSDYGRDLTEWQLMRELQRRDSFRNIKRFQTPLLLITHDGDSAYNDQQRYVSLLQEDGKEAYLRGYGGVFPGFLTAADNGARPASWPEARDLAWTTIFEFIETRIPGGAEELEDAAGE